MVAIGRSFLATFWVLLVSAHLHAALDFKAELDREEIPQDESVSLKFTVSSSSLSFGGVGEPSFKAPGFDVVSTYQNTHVNLMSENGIAQTKIVKEVTKVLRPNQQGDLKITDVQLNVDGKVYKAGPFSVKVTPPGAGTPPPQGYGGNLGLRGNSKRSDGREVLIRAEVNKPKLYKGEQLIVSYYLYRRAQVFNIQVQKYPIFRGFLKEDLEQPVMKQMTWEPTTLDGVAYQRGLLARFAVYPLETGNLSIDTMSIRSHYYLRNARDEAPNPNDPFSNFRMYFDQLAPQISNQESARIPIKVTALPESGKTESFTGGVGDFDVQAYVSEVSVHANQPTTYTIKIEGRGNLSAIKAPKIQWPEGIEVYETKERASGSQAGIGQKIFDFLLIPRRPGSFTIQEQNFSFFDPSSEKYVTKTTAPVQLQVGDPLPGTSIVTQKPALNTQAPAGSSESSSENQDIQGLRLAPFGSSLAVGEFFGQPLSLWLGALTALWILVFGIVVAFFSLNSGGRASFSQAKKKSSFEHASHSLNELRKFSKKFQSIGMFGDLAQAYEKIENLLLDTFEEKFKVSARSVSRRELGELLVVHHAVQPQLWGRIEELLEFSEAFRFSSQTGIVSLQTARDRLSSDLDEVEKILGELKG